MADLRDFTFEQVEAACVAWRRSGAKTFPKSGELLTKLRARRDVAVTAKNIEPWRPLSDLEYDALPLVSQMEHHRIMADHVMLDAAPIYRRLGRDRAVLIEDAEYRAIERRSANHLAEAKRLKGVLADLPAQPR